MTIYQPAPGIYVGRPPCLHCGANYHLHVAHGMDAPGACPERYRPDSLSAAISALQRSPAGETRFVARGEVQRLLGHRPGSCNPLCVGCSALLAAS